MQLIIRELYKIEQFISIFNIIKTNSSSVSFIVNKKEVQIQGMDKSHICLFDIQIDKKWFNEFEYDDNKDYSFCVDSNILFNILNNTSKNQSIVMSDIDSSNGQKATDFIYIHLINEDYKEKKGVEFDKYYKIQLNEDEYEWMDIPETEYDCDLLINSRKLVDITNQMLAFNNNIMIQCCEENVEFSVEGTSGQMIVKIPTDDLDEFSIEDGKSFSYTYSLAYLNKNCLTKNISEKINLSFSTNFPLKIKYCLEDSIDICFYIAPKLQE